jgi:hypothetical protein
MEIQPDKQNLFLFNESGQRVGSFRTVIQSLFLAAYTEMLPTVKQHLFDAPTFMATGNARFPRIKLLGIQSTVSVDRINQEAMLDGRDFLAFVMKDVISGNTKFINKGRLPSA